jgi:predicted nucleic acid-binding protein
LILYVESNFLLEIALRRDERESCESLIRHAKEDQLTMVMPSFCVGEVYEAHGRRATRRKSLHKELTSEIKELSRSGPFAEFEKETEGLTQLMVESIEFEKAQLDRAVEEILDVAELASLDASTFALARRAQQEFGLLAQDSIVLASIVEHLQARAEGRSCFITKDKGFGDPDVENLLEGLGCKLLFTFGSGKGYIESLR